MAGGRPGRRCGVCGHAHRAAIDAQLLSGVPQHSVAAEHGLSRDAVSRHWLGHVRSVDGLAGEVLSPAVGDSQIDLIGGVVALRDRLRIILGRAERARDLRTALLAVRECSRLLELHGRLTGQLAGDGSLVAVQINTGGSDPRATAALRERIAGKLAALAGPRPTVTAGAADRAGAGPMTDGAAGSSFARGALGGGELCWKGPPPPPAPVRPRRFTDHQQAARRRVGDT